MSAVGPYAEPLIGDYGSGAGWQELIPLAQPAAGLELTRQVPGQTIERPRSLVLRLVTDATVGSRFVELRYEDSDGNVYAIEGAAVGITASSDLRISFSLGRGSSEWNVGTSLFTRMPEVFMQPSHKLHVVVRGIVAADQISAAFLLLDRFTTDPKALGRRGKRHAAGG